MSKLKNTTFHIVDSPRRDLVWRLVLARKLQKAGIESFIGRADSISYLAQFKSNAILCGRLGGTSGRSNFDIELISLLEKRKSKIFYIHDEGGAFRDSDYERETKLNYPSDLFNNAVFQKIYFWGERQKIVFEGENWLNKSKIIGAPRFDVLKQKNKSNSSTKDIMQMNYFEKLKPYVLINSRFSNVLTSKDDVSALSRRMFDIRVEGGDRNNKSDDEIKQAMFSRWTTSAHDYIAFIEMLSKLCLEFKDINFVLRPHPAEDDEWYIKNLELIPNIRIEKQGDVQLAIENAEIVIGSDCTTGLEAILLGKNYINFIPFPNKGENTVGLAEIGSIVNSYEEIIKCLRGFLDGQNIQSTSLSIFDDSIINVNSDKNAINEIFLDIKYYFNNLPNRNTNNLFTLNSFLSIKSIKHFIKFLISPWRDIKNPGSKYILPNKKEIIDTWVKMGGNKKDIKFGYNYIKIKS